MNIALKAASATFCSGLINDRRLLQAISSIVIMAFALGNLAIRALYPVNKTVLPVNAAAPKAG